MPLYPHWPDLALRLAFALLAGVVIGFDRSERGREAGLRTTVLIALAAAMAMALANLLLATRGKSPDGFVNTDVMRLPLGILSGVGFIGAGAILRRGDHVRGVTTAATIWFSTVLGLCFGAGQLALGAVGLALGVGTLAGLRLVEQRLHVGRKADLSLSLGATGPGDEAVRSAIESAGFRVTAWCVTYRGERRSIDAVVAWRARPDGTRPPAFVEELSRRPGVISLKWNA